MFNDVAIGEDGAACVGVDHEFIKVLNSKFKILKRLEVRVFLYGVLCVGRVFLPVLLCV